MGNVISNTGKIRNEAGAGGGLLASMRATTAVGGALSAFAMAAAFAPAALAGPSGGQVKAGQAQISTQGARTTIRQNSDRVVIDWKSFDIDADEAVQFLQPGRSSVALNRVLDGLPTNIRGQLLANGNVWIVNQHGVVFHAGSVVNVGGLLATTSDISNADFMAGDYRFDKPGAPDAKIVNEGSITFGQAGLAAFVAPGVENRGVIAGKMGKVVIAGAETFAIDLAGDGMWAFTMGKGAKGASAKNVGRIHNPGGYILISAASAQGMVDSQISVGGVVEATTAKMEGGKIVLSGDGHVEVSGRLDATGAEAGQVGGGVEVTGETVHLTASAEIDVSGAAGGGSAKIGGDAHGGGALRTASRTLVSEGAEIRASAIGEVGDGGEVIVWADEVTGFFGSIEARSATGRGGFAEVSGKDSLIFAGLVDLTGAAGAGELLLDPANITIQAAGGNNDALDDNEILFGEGGAGDFTISAATIAGIAADVTLEATNDITVNAAVSKAAGGLTLNAGADILLNADLTLANGDLVLTADADFSLNGGPASDGLGAIIFGGGAISATNVMLSASEALALGDVTASGGLTAMTSDDAISQLGGTVLSVGGLASFDGGTADVTLDQPGNTLGAFAATGDDVTLRVTGNASLGAVTTTGALDVTATGKVQDENGATISVGGDATLVAGTQIDIDDFTALHNFGGAVSLTGTRITDFVSDGDISFGAIFTAQAGDVDNAITSTSGVVTFTDDVSIAGTSDLVLNVAGSVAQTGGTITADQLVLASDTGAAFTLGEANAVTSLATMGTDVGAVTLVDTGGIDLAGVTAASLDLTTTGAVTDSVASDIGTISVATAGFDVTLDAAGNSFGAISATGDNVTLSVTGNASLGAVTTTGALDVTATGKVQDENGATISVGGDATLVAGTQIDIDDVTALHNFGGAVSLTGTRITDFVSDGDISFGAIFTAQAGDVDNAITSTSGVVTFTDNVSIAGTSDLVLNVAGSVAQTGGTITADQLVLSSDAGAAFTLSQANAVTSLATMGTDVGAITLVDTGGIDLAGVTAASLDLTTTGAVTDSVASDIGTISVAATGFDVTLDAAANVFAASTVNVSGANIVINEADDVVLGSVTATGTLDVTAAGSITDTAGASISVGGATSLTARSGANRFDIALDNDTAGDRHDFAGAVSADGEDVTLIAANGVELGIVSAMGDATADDTINVDGGAEATDPGELFVAARNGAITDGATGAVTTTGDARFEATGNVTLDNLTHNFDSDGVDAVGDGDALSDAVSVVGQAVVVTDMNGLAVRGAAVGANGTFTASAGDLTLSTVTATGGAVVGIADAGGVAAADISAQTIALGGTGSSAAASTAATGAVSLERGTATTRIDVRSGAETALTDVFSGGALVTRAPTQRFTNVRTAGLDGGATSDFTAITGAAGAIDLLTLDRMTFGGDISISANEVRAGFLRTLNGGDLTVTALTGDVAKLADADIDFAGAATTSFGVALAGGGTTTVTDPNGAFGDLVSVTGDTAISAASGDVVLTRAYDGSAYVENEFAGSVAITAGGQAALEDKSAVTLGDVTVGGDLAVRSNSDDSAGGTDGIAQVGGTSISVTGTASFITGVHGGALDAAALADVTLTEAGNDFTSVQVLADDVAINDANGFSLTRGDVSGSLTLGTAGTPVAGALTIAAARIGGDLAFNATGGVTIRRVAVGGSSATSVDGRGQAGVNAQDLSVSSGTTRILSTGGGVTIDDFSIQGFDLDAATALIVTDGDMLASAGASTSGGATTLRNVTMTTGEFDAAGALLADAVRAGALSLSGDAGVNLGAVAVTGAFDATSSAGVIASLDAATANPAAVTVDAPGAAGFGYASGSLVTAEAGGTDPSDLRVNDSLGAGTATTLARTAFTRQVQVGGATTLDAAGSILLPREAAAQGGLHNQFGGTVNIASGSGDVAIEAAGAIAFGTVDVDGDSLTVRSNSDGAATAGAAGITQTGAMTVAGDAAFIASGSDVTLANAGNDFKGDVSVVSRDATLFDADDLSLTNSRVSRALDVSTTAGSATAGISISDVAVGGDATVDAGGDLTADRIDVAGDLDATSRLSGVSATNLGVDGGAVVTAATTASLEDAVTGDLTLSAGGTASLQRVISKSINVASGGVTIAGLSGDDVTIASSGDVDAEDVIADSVVVNASDSSIAFREASVDGALRLNATAGATEGDVNVADIATGGLLRLQGANIGVDGTNGATGARLSVGGALDVDASGAVALSDVTVANGADVAAAGDVSLDDFSFGSTTVAAGGDATLSDGAAGALDLTAGGTADLSNLRTGGAAVTAAAGASLDAMIVDGDLALRATAGDIGIGGVNVSGDLFAEAEAGSVFTVDTDRALDRVRIDGPVGASFTQTVRGPRARTIGTTVSLPNSPAGETRVTETVAAVVNVTQTAAAGAADNTILTADGAGGLLTVGGDAYVRATGDVALVDDAFGVTANNDFRGGLNIRSGGNVAVNDKTGLVIGAPTGVTLPSGATVARSGITAAGTLRIEAEGEVTQAAGAVLDIGGDALMIAGGDLIVDAARNEIDGAVALRGDDVVFAEAGSILLGQARARGDLSVTAGADGRLGAASIVQVAEVTVADVEVATRADTPAALADDDAIGVIRVDGNAEFSTGLDQSIALSDGRLSDDRNLTLNRIGNVFGGDLSVRRISGDAMIVEESGENTVQADANDGGTLRIRNFEVGGSSLIQTSDDVIFVGRMTALLDSETNPARVQRPGSSDAALQGDADIADADLRLFIANGETLTIRTTGGGFRPEGGDVRFDRPVDGDNNQPPVGSIRIAQERANLGGLTIDAGTDGEMRFRDFVGATNPLGPVELLGGDFYAGFTFADALPNAQTPRNRFLFDPANPDDFFFAGTLRVNVNGDLIAAVPPGSVAEFVRRDEYFGLNVAKLTFGDLRTPTQVQAFGFIEKTRQRAGGLLPVSPPEDPDFTFNDCVVGDVGDCTNLPISAVVNQVLILDPPIFDVEEDDLLELFGSFGNEELWGVPQSFISTEDINRQVSSECAPEEEECEEGS